MRIHALALLMCASFAAAQATSANLSEPSKVETRAAAPVEKSEAGLPSASLTKWAWDLNLYTDGGHSISGGIGKTTIEQVGVRLGKVLTAEHGPGWLRGNLEYSIGAEPMYIVNGPKNTAYGAGFDPFAFRLNFTHGQRIAPYFEVAAGMIFTNHEIPFGTSNINFTPNGALGMHIFTREKRSVNLEIKFLHISNARLSVPNPGLNALQFGIGYHWMK